MIKALLLVIIVVILPIVLVSISTNHPLTKVCAGEYWTPKNHSPFKPVHIILVKEVKKGWVLYDEKLEDGTVIYFNQTIEVDVFKRIYKKYE